MNMEVDTEKLKDGVELQECPNCGDFTAYDVLLMNPTTKQMVGKATYCEECGLC
jgi:C4-type Zn-finger protein